MFILLGGARALAGEKVDRTITASEKGVIYIENTRGQLNITGWDKPQIQLQGELDDYTKKLIFKSKGDKALIKVVTRGVAHAGQGSDLQVFVPKGSMLRFKGVDTDYKLSVLNGKIEGQTISGDLTVANVHAKMRLSTVSGIVDVVESSGVAKILSVSGKISFSGAFREADLESMSGNIMADISQIDTLKISNTSGFTRVSGGLRKKANIKLSSVTGDIQYNAGGGFNGECEIASQFGGQIKNRLTGDKPWSEKMQQRKLKFVSGDGAGKLVMNTVSGNVILEK